nr:hypothetical protein [uncultured Pseudodesulfovibrio sp.]
MPFATAAPSRPFVDLGSGGLWSTNRSVAVSGCSGGCTEEKKVAYDGVAPYSFYIRLFSRPGIIFVNADEMVSDWGEKERACS